MKRIALSACLAMVLFAQAPVRLAGACSYRLWNIHYPQDEAADISKANRERK